MTPSEKGSKPLEDFEQKKHDPSIGVAAVFKWRSTIGSHSQKSRKEAQMSQIAGGSVWGAAGEKKRSCQILDISQSRMTGFAGRL